MTSIALPLPPLRGGERDFDTEEIWTVVYHYK